MRKQFLVMALIAIIGSGAAVVGYDGPEDQPHIMSSESSASAAVGPNGTEYRASLSSLNKSCISGQETGLMDHSFPSGEKDEVNFTGIIKTGNPCYELDHEVQKISENRYRMNITSEPSEKMCVECVGMIKYEGSFSAKEPFTLEVSHDGEKVDTLEHPEYGEDSEGEDGEKKRGIFSGFMDWLRNLF